MTNDVEILSLDCQCFESTLESISRITQIDNNKIIQILTSLPIDQYYSIDDIWNKLKEHSSKKEYSYERIYWFHGSRMKNINSFLERGLLPLNIIMPELINYLDTLNNTIDINYSEPLNDLDTCSQLGTKLINQDGGPFAYLVREVFFEETNGNYDFLKLPEIIYDILNCDKKFKNKVKKITELYLNETKSCIVKFYDKNTDEHYLKVASLYLFRKINNIEMNTESNTCFSGEGQIVPFERIIHIETLDEK